MTLPDFLSDLRRQEIQIRAEGDKLKISAPPGAVTPVLRDQLVRRKTEILEFLHRAEQVAKQPPAIVPLQPRGTRTPIFAVAGHNGDVFAYRALAERLGADQPFFGLRPPGLDNGTEPIDRIEDLAAYFAGQILTFRPHGPFILAGYCAGGSTAVHTAHLLARWGGTVDGIALFGCAFPPYYHRNRLKTLPERLAVRVRDFASSPVAGTREYASMLRARLRPHPAPAPVQAPVVADEVILRRTRLEQITLDAVRRYTPVPFDGPVHLILPNRSWTRWPALPLHWRRHLPKGTVHYGPAECQWFNMLQEPFAGPIAALFVDARDRRPAPDVALPAAIQQGA